MWEIGKKEHSHHLTIQSIAQEEATGPAGAARDRAYLQSGQCPEKVALLQELLHKTNDTENGENVNVLHMRRTYLPRIALCSNANHLLSALNFDRRHFFTATTTRNANGEAGNFVDSPHHY